MGSRMHSWPVLKQVLDGYTFTTPPLEGLSRKEAAARAREERASGRWAEARAAEAEAADAVEEAHMDDYASDTGPSWS